MSIEEEQIITLATVEVAEDYRVLLTVTDLDTPFTHSQTEQLIAELQEALDDARRMLEDDYPILDPDTVAEVRAAHGFDVAPICRECKETKHGACDGQAIIELDDKIAVEVCGCAKVAHNVIASTPSEFTSTLAALEFLGEVMAANGLADDETPAITVRRAKRFTHPDIVGGDAAKYARVLQAEVLLRGEGVL
ncbi:hypothetical protein ACWKWN_08655 [Microbacterium trichothecenolyticum]